MKIFDQITEGLKTASKFGKFVNALTDTVDYAANRFEQANSQPIIVKEVIEKQEPNDTGDSE